MQKPYKLSLFIFRRDLRLEDNTALHEAMLASECIIPGFIFDPNQVEEKNEYRSMNALQFMVESLQSLEQQLQEMEGRLYLFYGNPKDVAEQLFNNMAIDAVFCNKDYTPFSIKRDEQLEHICNRYQKTFQSCHDVLLNPPDTILNQNGTPYAVFTAFYKRALQVPVQRPHNLFKSVRGEHSRTISLNNIFYKKPILSAQKNDIYKKVVPHKNNNLHVHGGRKEADQLLNKLKSLKDYALTHDFPVYETSNFAAHLKFGTVSVRELYYAITQILGTKHPLIRQLYWRDFFTYVAYHSPFVFGHAYQQKFSSLVWDTDKKKFERWCTGTTGFPIVDAGMRQLNATGFMHNRVRMIAASFLTKDLHIDWRMGEKYFAQHLVDYDPAVNNGNWQWCASTGCDAQPYFRIFNPWLQQKKFDPECEYIKTWIPELAQMAPKDVHLWYKNYKNFDVDYPVPMLDHALEARKTKAWFKD